MKKSIYRFAIIICISLSGTFIFPSCKSETKDSDTKSKKSTASTWKTIELGSLGLSVDAPFTFTEKDISNQLTPSVKKLVKKMETFVNDRTNESYSINAVEYQPETTLNMDAAVSGAIREITMKSGGKTSDRKDEKTKIDGNDATIATVTIAVPKKDDMELQMAIIGKENRMYQVMGIYKKSNSAAAENISRILSSIKIK